jgi:hypothetical protein
MIESYTPELNFITVSLISPLNGQHLHLTMDTMQYCISNQNSSASLEKLGIAASYGRGPISWIVGSIVRSQIPKPAPLRNGCWPWTVKLFEGLDSKSNLLDIY